MNQITDIQVMAHLKLVDFIYAKYQPTDKEIESLKLMTLHALGFKKINAFELEQLQRPVGGHNSRQRLPKKGDYIRAFIDMGFTHTIIAEWFEVTPANVSWHKQNTPKVEYENIFLQLSRNPDYRPRHRLYAKSDNT